MEALTLLILYVGIFGVFTAILAASGKRNKVLVALRYVGTLYIVNIVAIVIWYAFFGGIVYIADPWIPINFVLPISWEPIFNGMSATNYQPIGPLTTTGQIANLYYGIVLALSVAHFLYYALRKKNLCLYAALLSWHLLVLSIASIIVVFV